MTADLELYLRGLFVNRWRCPHDRVTQVFDQAQRVSRYFCAQCACVATVDEAEVGWCRSSSLRMPRLEWRRA